MPVKLPGALTTAGRYASIYGMATTTPDMSPALAAFGRGLNDALPNDRRQDLARFERLLPSTAGDGLDEVRGYLALDWLIREFTPAFGDLRPEMAGAAAALRALPRIVDLRTARAAYRVVHHAHRSAVVTVTGDIDGTVTFGDAVAVGDAAWFTVWSTVDAAGHAAACATALATARCVARSVVGVADAGRAALQSTVDAVQASAVALYADMINPAVARR